MKFPQEKVMNHVNALRILVLVALVGIMTIAAAAQTRSTSRQVTTSDAVVPVPEAQPPNLDQCSNGSAGDLTCTGSQWQNGNLNHTQSHWFEGDSVPYRVTIGSLNVGEMSSITIEWDTTDSGKHAIDYITSWDRTATGDPCSGVTGCTLASELNFPIPTDPLAVNQIAGEFSIYGGTITSVSGYTHTGDFSGASKASITVNFTANQENVVIAWGGHIATRLDWGAELSAIALPGSPYHMRLLGVGNQDRSLSVSAVTFPGFVTIFKSVFTNFTPPNNVTSSQSFDFTASPSLGGVTAFSLIDNYNQTLGIPADNLRTDRIVIPVMSGFGSPIRVTELVPLTWDLTDIQCSQMDGGLGNPASTFSINVASDFVDITLQEADFATCTFINDDLAVTAATATLSGRVVTSLGTGVNGARITVTNAGTGASRTVTTNPFGYYSMSGLEVAEVYQVQARHTRYHFVQPSRTITLNDDFAGMNFTATK